jgi:hypothetical protein
VGVGVLVTYVAFQLPACNRPDDWSCMPLVLSPIVGWGVGDLIDGARNRTLYLSPRGAGVTFAPVLGPAQVGFTARLRF